MLLRQRGKRLFTDGEIDRIRERYAAGESQGALARDLQVTPATIGRIVRGESYQAASNAPISAIKADAPPAAGPTQEQEARWIALSKQVAAEREAATGGGDGQLDLGS